MFDDEILAAYVVLFAPIASRELATHRGFSAGALAHLATFSASASVFVAASPVLLVGLALRFTHPNAPPKLSRDEKLVAFAWLSTAISFSLWRCPTSFVYSTLLVSVLADTRVAFDRPVATCAFLFALSTVVPRAAAVVLLLDACVFAVAATVEAECAYPPGYDPDFPASTAVTLKSEEEALREMRTATREGMRRLTRDPRALEWLVDNSARVFVLPRDEDE